MDIRIENLCKKFSDKVVFDNYSIVFRENQLNRLEGPSGFGKTTLLNILMGFEEKDSGLVTGLEGLTVSAVFQEDRLCEGFSALDNVMIGCFDEKKASKLLSLLGVDGKTDVSKLSGGQRRRVSIARCLCRKADLYILDEPFEGLDEKTLVNVRNVIADHTAGKTVILVSHIN